MRIQTLREATQGFNENYLCYWEFENNNYPISDFSFDKSTNTLFLMPYHSQPIHFKELNVILNALDSQTKVLIKTKSGETSPLFGFKIIEQSKILFS